MLSPKPLSTVYNTDMADSDMLDTKYMTQPRGEGTVWVFRMRTPDILIGRNNPRTGRPYGKAIRESLKSRTLVAARNARDILLGKIRQEELRSYGADEGSLDQAMDIAERLERIEDEDRREGISLVITSKAESIEKKVGTQNAQRWARVALGDATPFQTAYKKYLDDAGQRLSLSSKNNLRTAVREFVAFAGDYVALEDVNHRTAAEFVTEYLPKQKTPKTPHGPSPATIRKKVSQLEQIWKWAMRRGYLERLPYTPWTEQAPTSREIERAKQARRMFEPHETVALLYAAPPGTPLGDIIRVALLTGARLEEIASLEATQVRGDCRGYHVVNGKTRSAARYVPLVDLAREVIKVRMKNVDGQGPLFPELPVRPSTGKRGGRVSQAFTRLRRLVLGDHTDRDLKQHSFRHTWRTAARRAAIDTRSAHEMGGWSRGRATDLTYDHFEELEAYDKMQETVAAWLRRKGYLG